jgi:hypothetical protein
VRGRLVVDSWSAIVCHSLSTPAAIASTLWTGTIWMWLPVRRAA